MGQLTGGVAHDFDVPDFHENDLKIGRWWSSANRIIHKLDDAAPNTVDLLRSDPTLPSN